MASLPYRLNVDAATLSPLPPYLHRGLIAISSFAFLSFVCSTALFVYLTCRFINWALDRRNRRSVYQTNQFLVLIYNLLLADIQQSLAFLLNISAVVHNAINIDMPTCWAQGWFVSTGDLASSVFIFGIAVHTYLTVVKDYKIRQLWFYVSIVSAWAFIYIMALIGISLHPHDLYVRAGAWCWINSIYDPLRLWLHYLWIFIAMFGTVMIYAFIIITLQFRIHFNDKPPVSPFLSSRDPAKDQNTNLPTPHSHPLTNVNRDTAQKATGYLVLYPLIYVICTIPLAAGRMAAMTGVSISDSYFCIAGAMIASNGWLDVLLYGFTRGSIVFGHRDTEGNIVDAGRLESFMWYYGSGPIWQDGNVGDWGTVTVIEAGSGRSNSAGESRGDGGSVKMNADGRRQNSPGNGHERRESDSPLSLARKAKTNALSHLTRGSSTKTMLNGNKIKKTRRGTTSSTEDLYSMSSRGGDSSSMMGVGSFSGNEMGGIKAETTVDVRMEERRGGGYELRDVGGLGGGGGESKDADGS